MTSFKGGERRSELKKRLILSTLAVSFIAGAMVLVLIYYSGTATVKKSIGATFRELAETVSNNIALSIEHHIEESKLLASAQSVFSTIEDSNLMYEGLTDTEITDRISEIEERWEEGIGVNAYLFDVMNNRASEYLKDFVASGEEGIRHMIMVTNEKGAVVASTKKPAHYFYGNRKWWKAAFSNGIGAVYVSDIYSDTEYGIRRFDIATPVIKNGRAIGVILMSHNVDVFFKDITSARVGKTDHVMLVNSDGDILFCPVFGLEKHHVETKLLEEISKDTPGWVVTTADVHYPRKQAIVGFAPIKITFTLGKENFDGRHWYVFTSQDPRETFMPVFSLLIKIGIAGLIGAVLIIVLGYFNASKIVKPVIELQHGADRIGSGDLDYRITVRTGDEIEDLAERFNDMASKLKLFYIRLEEMVKERTRELEQRNEEISILYTVVSNLNQSLDLDKTLSTSLQTLMEVMKADSGVIWMLDNKRRKFTIVTSRGIELTPERNKRLSELFDYIGDRIINSGKIWTSENLLVDERIEGINISEDDCLSIVGIPLKSKDKVLAIMYLLYRNIKALTSREEDMLLSIGSHIGIAIENSLLFAKLLNHE